MMADSTGEGRIRPLPSPVSSVLNATLRIRSYESVAIELILNSLDARASRVRVTICPASLRLTVADNGCGVADEDIEKLGVRGWSSGREGRRGEALAAIAELASVEITTRAKGCDSWIKWMREGATLSVEKGGEKDASRLVWKTGTVVEVWELFVRLPVRRRAELARGERTMITLMKEIGRLIVANPNVSFVVQTYNGIVLTSVEATTSLQKERIEEVYGNSVVKHLYQFQSSPTRDEGLSVEGYMSRDAVPPSLSVQVISWNRIPVHAGSLLHKLVAKIWKSKFPQQCRMARRMRYSPSFVLNFTSAKQRTCVMRSHQGASVTFGDYRPVELFIEEVLGSFPETEESPRPQISRRETTEEERKTTCGRNQHDFSVVKRAKQVRTSLFRESLLDLRQFSRPRSTQSPRLVSSADNARKRFPSPLGTSLVKRPKSAAAVKNGFRKSLPSWTNPCFEDRGRTIRRIGIAHGGCSGHRIGQAFVPGTTKIKMTQDMIPRMQVIGQVDLKFILVRMDETLLAIDQHAASERYLMETLQAQVFPSNGSPKVESQPHALPSPIIELSVADVRTLAHSRSCIEQWGWSLEEIRLSSSSTSSYRIVNAPRVLDLTVEGVTGLREFLADIQRTEASVSASRLIPRAIMDTVATAACHKAVRFGDKLEKKECELLVEQLATCRFPFQCAHGRPSIVPLVVLDDDNPV